MGSVGAWVRWCRGPRAEERGWAHLNMPEPAMKQLAPASAHCAMVQSALTPPSTWRG